MFITISSILAAAGVTRIYFDKIQARCCTPAHLFTWQCLLTAAFYLATRSFGVSILPAVAFSIWWRRGAAPKEFLITTTAAYAVMFDLEFTAECATVLAAVAAAVCFYHVAELPWWARAAFAPLVLVAVARTLSIIITAFIFDFLGMTMFTAVATAVAFCALKWPEQGPAHPLLRFYTAVAITLAAHYGVLTAWQWPLGAAMLALGVAYTRAIMSRVDKMWPPQIQVIVAMITFALVMCCGLVLLHFPLLSTLLPISLWKKKSTEQPTLKNLRAELDHHVEWQPGAEHTRVLVPAGEEAVWHRHAATYYREVLKNQYFIDLD